MIEQVVDRSLGRAKAFRIDDNNCKRKPRPMGTNNNHNNNNIAFNALVSQLQLQLAQAYHPMYLYIVQCTKWSSPFFCYVLRIQFFETMTF